jgi:hypothetical protein
MLHLPEQANTGVEEPVLALKPDYFLSLEVTHVGVCLPEGPEWLRTWSVN